MTLEDHQTGKNIISPYFLIGKKGLTRYAINTESFRNCQNWLILPRTALNDIASNAFRDLDHSQLISVSAVIGDYNDGWTYLYGLERTISIRKPCQFEQEIGSIPLEFLKRELPKVYESINKDILHMIKLPNYSPF